MYLLLAEFRFEDKGLDLVGWGCRIVLLISIRLRPHRRETAKVGMDLCAFYSKCFLDQRSEPKFGDFLKIFS